MAQNRFLVDGAPQRGHMVASLMGVVLRGVDLVVVHFTLRGLRTDFPVVVTGIDVNFFAPEVAPMDFTGLIGPIAKFGQIGRHTITAPEERTIRGRIDDPHHRTGWIEVHDEVALLLTTGFNLEPAAA